MHSNLIPLLSRNTKQNKKFRNRKKIEKDRDVETFFYFYLLIYFFLQDYYY